MRMLSGITFLRRLAWLGVGDLGMATAAFVLELVALAVTRSRFYSRLTREHRRWDFRILHQWLWLNEL
jgi:hypothetical protein